MSTQEKVFFGAPNDAIFISNARMVLGGKTYAAANVTSVATYENKPNRKLEIIIGILGVLTFFGGSRVFGLVLIAAAVAIWFLKKTKYVIRLGSASGEADALVLQDKTATSNVVNAINEAIVFRG